MNAGTDRFATAMKRTIAAHALIERGQTVVVAVSGGPDSVALLHALAQRRQEWGIELVAAHLNHCFRGAESDGDADYVRDLAADLGVPFRMGRVDVPALKKRRRLSSQEAAREVRHAFLRRVAAEFDSDCIALGHTADDRIETVLLNIMRGTGIDGLCGFPPKNPPLVRPLYDIRRTETEAYCRALDLQPRTDSSNLKTDYRRNRIRAELLPHLASYYNERVDRALLRLSDLAAADNSVLEDLAEASLAGIADGTHADRIRLPAAELTDLPLAIQRRVLRLAVHRVRHSLADIGHDVIENALQCARAGETAAWTLPSTETGTVALRCDGVSVTIEAQSPPSEILGWQVEMMVPGVTPLFAVGLSIETYFCNDSDQARRIVRQVSIEGISPRFVAAFPRDSLKLPLIARSWISGDRMRPKGLGGTKKLQDIFTDAKVPAARRRLIPVITDGEGRVICVSGLRAAEGSVDIKGGGGTRSDAGPMEIVLILVTGPTLQ